MKSLPGRTFCPTVQKFDLIKRLGGWAFNLLLFHCKFLFCLSCVSHFGTNSFNISSCHWVSFIRLAAVGKNPVALTRVIPGCTRDWGSRTRSLFPPFFGFQCVRTRYVCTYSFLCDQFYNLIP